MLKFPCSLCGSRNWPSKTTSCPLCQCTGDDEPEDDESYDESYDESFDDRPL